MLSCLAHYTRYFCFNDFSFPFLFFAWTYECENKMITLKRKSCFSAFISRESNAKKNRKIVMWAKGGGERKEFMEKYNHKG